MSSQAVDIFSLLNKAQTEYNQQQAQQSSNSVAAFFRQATQAPSSSNNRSLPIQIQNVNSLEQIERQIRSSPPPNQSHETYLQSQRNDLANSPLAHFINSNNFNNVPIQSQVKSPPMEQFNLLNGPQPKVSAPPGFNKVQPLKNLLANGNGKETHKLITPTMFTPPSSGNVEKKPTEPLTKNQLLQALNYLIQNDEEFTVKIHDAYLKTFNSNVAT